MPQTISEINNMTDLVKLIEREGHRNNMLKKALEEGKLPSEELANELSCEELYKIAVNSVDFTFKTKIEILKSSYHFVQLVDLYVLECESHQRVPEANLDFLRDLSKQYKKESESILNGLSRIVMQGYESSW